MAVISRYAGPTPDAIATAAAARRAYAELARVSAVLIGTVGFDVLASRAVHLARPEYPRLADTADQRTPEGAFAVVLRCVQGLDPVSGGECAAAVLGRLAGLLVAFVGEGLTWRLLREAWPVAFADEHGQEADTA